MTAAPAIRHDVGCASCEGTNRNLTGNAPCVDCSPVLASLDRLPGSQRDRLQLLARRSKRQLYDLAELWNERAAHREYDAGKSRKEAERLALDDVADMVLR